MENDLKIIELTKGYKVIVDSDNYDELLKYKWYANCVSNLIYAYRTIRVTVEYIDNEQKDEE